MNEQTNITYPNTHAGTAPSKKKGRAQEIDQHIGKKIKELRQLKKMTQNDLADKLNISFQQIQKYEKGKSRISFAQIIELSKYMGVPLVSFIDQITANSMGMADSAQQANISQTTENIPPSKDTNIEELINIYRSLDTPQEQKDLIRLVKTLADNLKA